MIRTFRLTNARRIGVELHFRGPGACWRAPALQDRSGICTEAGCRGRLVDRGGLRRGSDPAAVEFGLIAQALNRGDFAHANIAAVLARAPELSREAAARLANAEKKLAKYDPDEPRDWHGRWTSGGVAGPASAATAESAADRRGPPKLAVSGVSGDAADTREQAFERKYDELGPVDFAKEVIQFGDRLGREGRSFSPAERERALAEYAFLQDRLSFWLDYDYKPATAHANLLSAALTLYQGAINGGIARAGELPRSMVDVGGAVWAFDNLPPRIRPSTKPNFESTPGARVEAPREIEGIGGVVNNREAGIVWGKGVKEQGEGWELYVGKENPDAVNLAPNAKAFDHFNLTTQEAISAKTLNTLSVSYIKKPERIYQKLKGYVDAAADYEPRVGADLDPSDIRSKTIQLAISEYTSPTQWQYLQRAKRYGRDRGVSIVITRIRE